MTLNNNLYKIISENHAGRSFELELIPDCVIYRAHFPEQPITPGVCIIQIASELLDRLTAAAPELTSVVNAKYLAIINPRQTRFLTCTFTKLQFDDSHMSVKAAVSVSNGDTLFTKLSLVYKIK